MKAFYLLGTALMLFFSPLCHANAPQNFQYPPNYFVYQQRSPQTKYFNEPSGFRNIKWGTEYYAIRDEEKLTLLPDLPKKLGYGPNVTIAVKEVGSENYIIGGARAYMISYYFWKGLFFAVRASFENDEIYELIRSAKALYGSPTSYNVLKSPLSYFYLWEGEKTTIDIFASDRSGNVHMSSTYIERQEKMDPKPLPNTSGW